jgi:aminoglycoside phosphotransferase (APT) family kinase protein
VIRVNRSSQWGLTSEDQLRREYAVLERVGGTGHTPVPFAMIGGETPFLVESFVPGRKFSYSTAGLRFAAIAIADVHATPVSNAPPTLGPGDARTDLIEDGEGWLAMVPRSGRPGVSRKLLSDFASTIHVPTMVHPESIIHTDLIHGNMLLTSTDCKIVDWEGARLGPIAWDLAYFLSPVTTRWATGFRELKEVQAALFLEEYARRRALPIDLLRREVAAFMPLVVFRALSWCLGYEASTVLTELDQAAVGRFTQPTFVEHVIRGFEVQG